MIRIDDKRRANEMSDERIITKKRIIKIENRDERMINERGAITITLGLDKNRKRIKGNEKILNRG